MPLYTFINTETNEEFEELMSWSKSEEYVQDNPHIKRVVCAPKIGYNDSKKPDEGFRDILRDIKKGSGTGANINTF